MKFSKYFGPSTLVTAAFIGPGTLTVCTMAGAGFGYELLWVLLFATIATIFLQEMTARIGLLTQKGLGEALRSQLQQPVTRAFAVGLVFVAIAIGNAAYEAGNISGAVLGISGVFGESFLWAPVIGLVAFGLLYTGKIRLIERMLIALVFIMSFIFTVTAFAVQPSIEDIFSGLFSPHISTQNAFVILGLVGTTIVPYNLFLHASSVSSKWKHADSLKDLRRENAVAIGLGGLISIAIVITSGTTLYGQSVSGMGDMALQLEPLLGSWSRYFLAIGLFAAGISSAITAPLAAAYATQGVFGWNPEMTSLKFRLVWATVLILGTTCSMLGYKPIQVIQLAQVANGVLLPIIVCFLVYLCNRKSLLGRFVNKWWQNLLAILFIALSILLSFKSLNGVFAIL